MNNPKSNTNLFLAHHFLIGALLLVLMVITRGNHFISSVNLPSASIAVFFLAGIYLFKLRAFWFYYIASIVIDLSVTYAKGDFGSCITNTYPLLAFSYGAVFFAGRWLHQAFNSNLSLVLTVKTLIVLVVSTTLAFIISNGSYYWFSGMYADPYWAEYTARFAKYYPSYILKPMYYVLPALLMHLAFFGLQNKRGYIHGAKH